MVVAGNAPAPEGRERADSRRKRLRLVDAARTAVAQHGLDVAAADIAARAEVGIGTLYRRFGSKEALIEVVLLEATELMADAARRALDDGDPESALASFVTELARTQVANRGLAEFTRRVARPDAELSEPLRERTTLLRDALAELTVRAQAAGAVRADVSWRDIAVLAQAAAGTTNCLGVEAGGEQWRRTLGVLMDGLRPVAARPLPGIPPDDSPGVTGAAPEGPGG
ncbi:TetR/AcrR family transcriptional regulator [Streptomyces litchfieldiae]|uniref:TetR/AcrR family transcriptional regulator n=1 Tax=Streptomyces litchfieldiae TaxID=3075543 RepID=A0ABU2MZY6_9ACTN|nr:TetR/AcrR family transcriptional regulator [Streptomyces sp. DSM 44938]MDT0346388.1 TetR/AcrR family transcriptional regulator [Streptomyces sp. DSM 44938]